MIPFRVRTNPVVVIRELLQDVVQMPLSEDQELSQAFQLNRLDPPLAPRGTLQMNRQTFIANSTGILGRSLPNRSVITTYVL